MYNIEMMTVNIELLGDVNVYFGMGLKVITAFILGGLIGLDREKKLKAAGIKTNMLICIGAALYTSISLMAQRDFGGVADPNRVAAQVVSGIGFLGAGAIIQGSGGVVGLTTAATIWVVAAVGVAVGAGYPIIAAIFTLTILVVLKLLAPVYKLLDLQKDYHIEVLSHGTVKKSVRQILLVESDYLGDFYEEVLDEESDQRILHAYISANPKVLSSILEEIKDILQVKKVNSHITESHR